MWHNLKHPYYQRLEVRRDVSVNILSQSGEQLDWVDVTVTLLATPPTFIEGVVNCGQPGGGVNWA